MLHMKLLLYKLSFAIMFGSVSNIVVLQMLHMNLSLAREFRLLDQLNVIVWMEYRIHSLFQNTFLISRTLLVLSNFRFSAPFEWNTKPKMS